MDGSSGKNWTRREWLAASTLAGGLWLLGGCLPRWARLPIRERRLLYQVAATLPIVQWRLKQPDPRSVLRLKSLETGTLKPRHRLRIDQLMRATLAEARGVGLAAPQVGLPRRMILVQLQGPEKRILTCIDPEILRSSSRQVAGYEACLSIAGVGGKVRRARWVDISYRDLEGKAHRHHARDWEARIFQHEIDHLKGVLYIDRLVGRLMPMEEMRRRREEKSHRNSEAGSQTGPLLAAGPIPDQPWIL